MTECMQTCEKMDKSRGLNIKNVAEMKAFLQKFGDIVFVPGTSKLFPKALNAAWLAITDENEEDNWVDWYNGNNVDILDGVNGQLGTVHLESLFIFPGFLPLLDTRGGLATY